MDATKLPVRKPNRLKDFDYSSNGMYFITICVKNRKPILWENVGASNARPQQPLLSLYGGIVEEGIASISTTYPTVKVDKYVVMPNHIHLLLQNLSDNGRAMLAPTISNVVRQFKGAVTKKIGYSIWQKSFYDHIIRNERDYQEAWKYIDGNINEWLKDELYVGEQILRFQSGALSAAFYFMNN